MVWKNIPPDQKNNWSSLNEGQRRYAWEQYKLALLRRGLSIDHPVPEVDQDNESVYETALEDNDDDSDAETVINAGSDKEEDSGSITEYFSDDNEDSSMPPPIGRSGAEQGGGPTGVKRPRIGEASSSSGGNKGKLPGTAKDQGNGAGGLPDGDGQLMRLPSPFSKIHDSIRYFRKVHRFLTFGVAYHIIEKQVHGVDHRTITTPLALIPWEFPYLYLSPAEFSALPTGSSVNKVRVGVRVRNARIAFSTNSTETTTATLNQQRDVCYALGLNKELSIRNAKYTKFQDNERMIPTDYTFEDEDMHRELKNDLYGKKWAGTPLTVPRHQMGIPTPLPVYAVLPYHFTPYDPGYPCLQEKVKYFDYDNAMGKDLQEVEYHPKCGLLTVPYPSLYQGFVQWQKDGTNETNVTIARQGGIQEMTQSKLVLDADGQPQAYADDRKAQIGNKGIKPDQLDLTTTIEKSQYLRHGVYGNLEIKTQPSLHVAVQPIPAITTKALGGLSNSSFTDVQGYWEIVCDMEVNTKYPTPYPLMNGTHNDQFDSWFTVEGTHPHPFFSMYHGLRVMQEQPPTKP